MKTNFIDVREYPEFAEGYIEGSILVTLNNLGKASEGWDREAPLILVCKTGQRAEQARQQLAACGFTAVSVLEGGTDSWLATGKPLSQIEKRPWSMERQVRTAAGSLVLIKLALASTVSHAFLFATAFVGAGLVFAGVSNTCLMASILGRLPWNRPARCAQ